MKIGFITVLFPLLLISCTDKRQALGKAIYHKVLNYHRVHGRLPENLSEIGVEEKMEGPVYYNKQTDSTFIVYYGGGLGESIFYDPKSETWRSDGGLTMAIMTPLNRNVHLLQGAEWEQLPMNESNPYKVPLVGSHEYSLQCEELTRHNAA